MWRRKTNQDISQDISPEEKQKIIDNPIFNIIE